MKNYIIGGFIGYFVGGFLCSYLLLDILKKGNIKNV